jgi:hypothetical protein
MMHHKVDQVIRLAQRGNIRLDLPILTGELWSSVAFDGRQPAQRNTTSSCSCFPRNQAAMADVSLIELLDQLNLSKYREVMEENEVR